MKEALKLALEAIKNSHEYRIGNPAYEQVEAKIEEALAQPEQEPVAVRTMRMWITALKSVSDNGQHMKIPSGLSSGTCWELAVELERFINTTPPPVGFAVMQKQWVGLTDDEQRQCIYDKQGFVLDYEDVVYAVEAKLKEKNNG